MGHLLFLGTKVLDKYLARQHSLFSLPSTVFSIPSTVLSLPSTELSLPSIVLCGCVNMSNPTGIADPSGS